jgi:hypothetical protein
VPSSNKTAKQNFLLPSIFLFGSVLIIYYQASRPKPIYWGAWIAGDTYGVENPPWDTTAIDIFEEHAGKQMSILHWGQPWWYCGNVCRYQMFDFQKPQYEVVRQRGYIPLVDWASFDFAAPELLDQPEFSLSTILAGNHDEYIHQWATQARDWGHPFFLRFNWEMNGWWFPWSEGVNGNQSGEFVLAWRHIHDIFAKVGAENVTWVWCPNVIGPKTIPLETLYPGDEYVDWLCMDGYNTGTNPLIPDRWRSFSEVFGETYSALLSLAPEKPIMIAEVASTEAGGSKESWIRVALIDDLPTRFPRVKAIVWFNWNDDGMDWVIESSPEAQIAFAESVATIYYMDNQFANLEISPIPPGEELTNPWANFLRTVGYE